MTATNWINQVKPGEAWTYNSPFIAYNGTIDSDQNLTIYYNALGLATAWIALSK